MLPISNYPNSLYFKQFNYSYKMLQFNVYNNLNINLLKHIQQGNVLYLCILIYLHYQWNTTKYKK